MSEEATLISREEAAEMIGVSVRTLDRYIAKKRFSSIRRAGKVFLRREEIENYKSVAEARTGEIIEEDGIEMGMAHVPYYSEEGKYKILYEESLNTIEKKDAMLRQMHYQLGILENESKHNVPLLEAQSVQKDMEEKIGILSYEKDIYQKRWELAQKGRVFFFALSIFLFFSLLFFYFQTTQF
jgi:predicted transcriptional regulator